MTTQIDYFSLLAKHFPLFPLNGKVPAVKAWQLSALNPKLTRQDIPGNYGVVLTPTTLVIDVDVKKKAPGMASFHRLTKDLGLMTGWEKDTFVVKTGTGGFHIYLTKPAGLKIKKNVKEYPGIDFLSAGHYVVGPTSVHPDTKVEYTRVFGSPGGVRPAPDKLDSIIAKTEVESLPVVEKDFVDNDPMTVERFKTIIDSMPPAQQGGLRNSTYVTACRGRDLGLSQQVCIDTMLAFYNPVKCTPPLPEEELAGVVRDAYKYAKGQVGNANPAAIFQTVDVVQDDTIGPSKFDVDKGGKIRKTLHNCVEYLRTLPELQKLFRYNTFTEGLEIDANAPWFSQRSGKNPNVTDEDIVLLKFFLSKTTSIEFSQDLLMEAIIVMAYRRHYHPIRNYLNSLTWDGQKRLDTWLSEYGGAIDNAYTRAVGRKTLCAAVRRVFEPGCKWDHVLILEGPQGIGKSTFCRILGRMWSGDMNLDPHQKDSVHMMLGKWIIELSEMVALRWSEASALKSFITRERDTVRLSYARHAKDYPRQSIFIGTVNPDHVGYLSDMTGNRRFWIVNLPKKMQLRAFEDNCDQLWAEAYKYYRSEELFLSGEAEILQGYESLARMPEDPMKRHVGKFIIENPNINEVEINDLLAYCGIPAKSTTKMDQSRLAQALIDHKWEKRIDMTEIGIRTYYVRPVNDIISKLMDEI